MPSYDLGSSQNATLIVLFFTLVFLNLRAVQIKRWEEESQYLLFVKYRLIKLTCCNVFIKSPLFSMFSWGRTADTCPVFILGGSNSLKLNPRSFSILKWPHRLDIALGIALQVKALHPKSSFSKKHKLLLAHFSHIIKS